MATRRKAKRTSFVARLRRSIRKWGRLLRRRRNRKILAVVVLLALIGVALTAEVIYQTMPTRINPEAYVPLLNTIAEGESKGNYNAYFGNAGNTTVHFTDMSVEQVLAWQADYVRGGSPSSAVGRYQLVRPTLAGLVRQLQIDPKAKFNKSLQDQLAITLMERRGSVEYVDKKLTREQFAANLAKEWAALPKVTGPRPQESYYAGDGLNQSRVSITSVYSAVDKLRN
jgi:conjugal transfer mating pair stabilization protein TraG